MLYYVTTFQYLLKPKFAKILMLVPAFNQIPEFNFHIIWRCLTRHKSEGFVEIFDRFRTNKTGQKLN